MKRRLLLAAAVLGAAACFWIFVASFPPVAITARYVGRTNYPSGWTGLWIAVTNATTNDLTVLVPMDRSNTRRTKLSPVPTNVFFCPVKFPARQGKVSAFLQTDEHQQKLAIHFGEQRDYSGLGYRLRRWLRLPRGQPRDYFSNPHTLVLDLPPE